MKKENSIEKTIFQSKSEEETKKIGREIAGHLHPGIPVLISGELGAGKTILIKGIASYFDVDESDVHSPSFKIIQTYKGKTSIIHVDLYRIEEKNDIRELGLEELACSDELMLIEWGEKVGDLFDDVSYEIRIEYRGDRKRKITLKKRNF